MASRSDSASDVRHRTPAPVPAPSTPATTAGSRGSNDAASAKSAPAKTPLKFVPNSQLSAAAASAAANSSTPQRAAAATPGATAPSNTAAAAAASASTPGRVRTPAPPTFTSRRIAANAAAAAAANAEAREIDSGGTEICLLLIFIIGVAGISVFVISRLRSGGGGAGDAFAGGDDHSPFGAFGGGGNARRARADIKLHLRVSLESIYNGESIEISYPDGRLKQCAHCGGTGGVGTGGVVACKKCGGKGVLEYRMAVGPGFYQNVRQPCDACGGRGQLIRHVCPKCNGQRVSSVDEDVTVPIPKGCPEGEVIVMRGLGHASPTGGGDSFPSGDLIVTVFSDPHPVFTRSANGTDLSATLSITLKQALLGFTKPLTLLDGSVLNITNLQPSADAAGAPPAVTIIRPDAVMTFPGYGMPAHGAAAGSGGWWPFGGSSNARGTFFVRFKIVFPPLVTTAQRDKLIELLGPLPDDA